jgi:hypothetical protein
MLQARRRTIREVMKQLEHQRARLLEAYLAAIIEGDGFERKWQEIQQDQQGLAQQLHQLEAQTQQQLDLIGLTRHITAFCQRLRPTLDRLDFTQRRQPVELLIDRAIVGNGQAEIRDVITTSPPRRHSLFALRIETIYQHF